jgi:hypothetical protein
MSGLSSLLLCKWRESIGGVGDREEWREAGGGGEERSCDVGRGERGVRFRSDVRCVRLRRLTTANLTQLGVWARTRLTLSSF